MIPKIIHLCWLSGDAYPETIQSCINSWKRHLPDYKIYLWDTNRFDINSSRWVKEAFEAKKYAFAADYIRLYALYHYGGIYLDSDVLVYKSFDDLLDLPYFIGEDNVHCFEAAVIGAQKGNPWIKDILDRYKDRSFIQEDGSFDIRTLPTVFHDVLMPDFQFRYIKSKHEFQNADNLINVFPYDHFNARDFVGIKRFKNSYCSHNFAGSWVNEPTIRKRIKACIPHAILNTYYKYRIYFSLLFIKENFYYVRIPYNNYRYFCYKSPNTCR